MENQTVTIEKISDTELNRVVTTKERKTIDDLRNECQTLCNIISDREKDITSLTAQINELNAQKTNVQVLIAEFESIPAVNTISEMYSSIE